MINALKERMKKRSIDEFEILQKKIKKEKVEVNRGKVEDLKVSEENQITLRIIKERRMGFSYITCDKLKDEDVDDLIEKAVGFLKYMKKDDYYRFYDQACSEKSASIDREINELTSEKMIELATKIEDAAYNYDKRIKVVKNAGIQKGEMNVYYYNSHDVEREFSSNFVSGAVVTVAEENGESYMGYENYVSRRFDIDPSKIGETASKKAVRMFGSRKGKSMKVPVIFENELVSEILSLIAPSFYLENIEKKKSLFFQNKIGDKIGSDIFTLIDDGTIEGYNGTIPFDDEGISTSKKFLIKEGTLSQFLNNFYYSLKFNYKPTGNGFKPSFKSPPSISITNLILTPGERSVEEEIKNIDKGLFLVNLMGLHMANTISGDFSLGAEGILIENGELTFPVKEFIISGNIKDILKGTKLIFNDVKPSGTIYSPSILIEGLKISG